MKDLHDILKEITEKEISLEEPKKFLFEEDDFGGDDGGGDPFGGDDGGDGGDPFGGGDDAGGDDPFGGDSGDDAGGDSGDGADGEDGEGDEEDEDEEDGLDLEDYEDDPDFSIGQSNSDDVTITDQPAAGAIFDIDDIMQKTASLLSELSTEQLTMFSKVKRCVEIIFNGKILKDEDLEFTNIDNAIFLINKLCEKLDIKTRAYLTRKFKEPMILKRDAVKQDMADKQAELDASRDMVIKLDTMKFTGEEA